MRRSGRTPQKASGQHPHGDGGGSGKHRKKQLSAKRSRKMPATLHAFGNRKKYIFFGNGNDKIRPHPILFLYPEAAMAHCQDRSHPDGRSCSRPVRLRPGSLAGTYCPYPAAIFSFFFIDAVLLLPAAVRRFCFHSGKSYGRYSIH